MIWKMDELGEPYFDPLDRGREGYINEDYGDPHEYGGGFRLSDEVARDWRGSILTVPREPVFKSRRTRADSEYAEALYLNALHDRKNKHAESNATTMRGLFKTINRAAE